MTGRRRGLVYAVHGRTLGRALWVLLAGGAVGGDLAWVLGIVAAFSVLAVIIDHRRGSTGASRAHDEPGTAPARHWLNYRGDVMND